MKKIFSALFIIAFSLLATNALANTTEQTRQWTRPRTIKTYIPAGNKRTTMMKHAFAEWSRKTNNKVVFVYTDKPAKASVKVEFVDKIQNAERAVGLTRSAFMPGSGNMVGATIYIAAKTQEGYTLGNDAVYTVMLHEIGHALGLNHSSNIKSIMYPTEDDRQEVLGSDLKALGKIYGW